MAKVALLLPALARRSIFALALVSLAHLLALTDVHGGITARLTLAAHLVICALQIGWCTFTCARILRTDTVSRRRWAMVAGTQVAAIVAAAFAFVWVDASLDYLSWVEEIAPNYWAWGSGANFSEMFQNSLFWGLFDTGIWAGVVGVPEIAANNAVRRVESERLRGMLELETIRGSLNSHFLRNSLNTIAALVGDDPDVARRLLASLSDLLDGSVEKSGPQTAGEQLEWLRHYTGLLSARYGPKLRFEFSCPNELRAAPLPRLLLQPLVENAVEHGLLSWSDGGVVQVRFTHDAHGLQVDVEDRGEGERRPRMAATTNGKGNGLRLVERQLALWRGGPNGQRTAGALTSLTRQWGTCVTVHVPVEDA